MARWLAVVFVVGCGRSSEPAQVTLPPTPSAPIVHASVTAPSLAVTSAPRFTVIGGDVVDLERMSVTRTLTSGELVFAHAITADTTYVWVHGDVRAFDAATGVVRWSKPESECRSLAATNAGAYCATGGGARFFRASNGDAAIVGPATAATQVVTMGPRVVVLYSDAKVVALDPANAVVATTTLPAMPDHGYGAGPLEVSGDRACGAQRSDTSTKVFCFDATPRILWSKVSPVPGGLLRQVDDAIVLASDTWSHAASSEVLRATDGATLLSIPIVRLGAALTTRGVLDGALASEVKLTFYDASGAVKWASSAPHRSESIRAKRFGANVVVAFYSPIATGTLLDAFDLATGTLAWQGDVESLPISHSKYSNRVELDVRGRDVLLVGRESSQEYAESFDGVTGKRVASVLRGR